LGRGMRNVAAAGGTRRTHRVALLANDRRLRLLLLGVVLLGATHILSTHRFVPDLHSDADPRADQLLIGGKGWPAGVWWEHSALKQYQVSARSTVRWCLPTLKLRYICVWRLPMPAAR
jgi:hypothetical protein